MSRHTIATTTGQRMPVYFIPHGAGPCFFMDWNPADTWLNMAHFLKNLAADLPRRPSAILLVSGHWLEPQFSLTGHARPPLIFDYSGFPSHTYELTYPAPGNPALAERAVQLLRQEGLASHVDGQRGFDHGVFIPLKLVFPSADIPVVQMSLRHDMDPAAHLEAGKALESLRDQDVLIVGSGMSFHNMRGYGDPRYTPISVEFDDWLSAAVESPFGQREALLRSWTQAPHARHCHPPGGEEHLIPLLVATGAAGVSPGSKVYSERVMETALSAYRFG
ncbi:class III extradiol ring-cleavage dioxygenase [Pusillimonas sp.]|uniref:DODA-type extradiol aromatic ring-opening family dioxygenase n=1 Tax=Pusillimonas sp. TaxID=3040095 RepID=UPI0029B5A2CD|nr:class III extradiol ring-cleavage dioxygenase [Pusillimonas sp.]MDX3895498.1 class III extradiol ring-cleavage dioxygenase [Pusillimonas sp.]